MPSKDAYVEGIGKVTLLKRKGSRSVRLRIRPDGQVTVTLPHWLPYSSALQFALTRKDWILAHKAPRTALQNGQRIGRSHRISFMPHMRPVAAASVKDNVIIVRHPPSLDWDTELVQSKARQAAIKALKKESDILLPQRVQLLTRQHGFSHGNLAFKMMRSRWGSCSATKDIVLNIYLVQLPWELVDYVILHELCHTEELSHSTAFWQRVAARMPDYKERRARLKAYQPTIMAIP